MEDAILLATRRDFKPGPDPHGPLPSGDSVPNDLRRSDPDRHQEIMPLTISLLAASVMLSGTVLVGLEISPAFAAGTWSPLQKGHRAMRVAGIAL